MAIPTASQVGASDNGRADEGLDDRPLTRIVRRTELGGPFGISDLEATPSDAHRYEVLDGALVVSPPPHWNHQRVVARLCRLLQDGAPTGVEAFPAPLGWLIDVGDIPEPDVMVVERSALGDRYVERAPLLVLEVLSPSGRRRELVEKRTLYESAGCPNYWVVDPAEPSLLVLSLAGGSYAELARVVGCEACEAPEPFAVRVVPAELVD